MCCSISASIYITFTMLLLSLAIYRPATLQLEAVNGAYVASNTPNSGENNFVTSSDDGGFETALNLRNCTLLQRFEIGVVTQDSTGSTEGLPILEAVFNDLAEAYRTANADVGGYTMSMKQFETTHDLHSYVEDFDYRNKALCFAIGWHEYEPSEHKFAIDLRWNFGTILNTRLPQVEYEESAQNQSYLPQYAHQGFLQAMTSVTDKILTEVYGSTSHSIQMLYMPMNSVEFENDGFAEVVGALIPMSLAILIGFPDRLKLLTSGSDEDKVQRLLQRFGMRKSVEVYMDYVVWWCMMPLLVFVCYLASTSVMKTTSFWFVFWNMIIYSQNTACTNQLIRFAIDDREWAERLERIIELLGVSVVIQSYLFPTIEPWFVNYSTLILPLPGLNWIIKLGIIASNKNINVEMLQPNPIVNGNDMTDVMHLALIALAVKLAVQIWCWPFKVFNDEHASRGPCYFLKCSFWREICCCCNGQSANEDNLRLTVPDFYDGLLQSTNDELSSSQESYQDANTQLHLDELEMIKQGTYESLENKQAYCGKSLNTLKLDKVEVKHKKHTLVDDLSLTIFENEVFMLLGENGTGKTNVLHTMAGFQEIEAGMATAFGVNLSKDLRFLRKTLLAYSEQEVTLIDVLTPAENLDFVCKFLGIKHHEEIVKQTLKEFDLQDCAHINVKDTSPVDRKKLSLALNLISGARVILLDAPTDGMTIGEKRAMWQLIRARRKGRVIVVATQDIEEAEQLGDRICLLTNHAKVLLCGSPKFFAEKCNFTLQVLFTFKRLRDASAEQKMREDLRLKVEEAIEPKYRDQVSITWNNLGQLAVKLPTEIKFKTVNKCIDFESVLEFKGQLFEDVQVKRDTLAQAFEHKKKTDEDDNEPQQKVMVEPRARKISCCRSTGYLIQSEFGRKSLWTQMLKLFFAFLLIIGQETLIMIFLLDNQSLPVINLTSIEETWEEMSPPINIFVNSVLPDQQQTSTEPLLKAYTDSMNTEEEKQVAVTEIEYTPSSTAETVQSVMSGAAEEMQELAEEAEEDIEYFAGFYIYTMDEQNHAYSVGVYGNQIAAASTTSFGATMLQTIAQKVSGQSDLSLEIRNYMLPINPPIMPITYPNVAEAFGVTILAACVVLLVQQVYWHGKPIQTGFLHAFLVKGGRKSSFYVTKYLKLALSNAVLIAVILILIYGQKLAIGGAVPICIAWIFFSPFMVLAFNHFFILALEGTYEETSKKIQALGGSFITLAFITAGAVAFSQGREQEYTLVVWSTVGFVPLILFQSVVFGFLYDLQLLIENQERTEVEMNPYKDPFSYVYFYLPVLIWVALLWGIFSCLFMKTRSHARKTCCCRIRDLEEDEDGDWQVMVNQQLHLEEEENNLESDIFLQVEKLQCMRFIQTESTNTQKIRTSLEKAQLVYVNHKWFSRRTTRGVSFSIRRGEKFAILGDRFGVSCIIRTIMGFKRQIAGSYRINGIADEDFKKLYGIVGYQPHTNSIDEELTVRQHLNLFVKLVGVPKNEREMTVAAIIDDCLLKGHEDIEAGNMSHGMLRRLTLAMALIGKPEFVVLDDPLQGIDPVTKHKLIGTIHEYTSASTLLLATSECDEAELLCDRIAIMHHGKFMAMGRPSQIIEQHGQGYSVDVHVDLDKLHKQVPKFSHQDALLINNEDEAMQTLEKMQSTLQEKKIEASFDFCSEFKKEGQLENLYEQVKSSLPYPIHKFYTQVLTYNLAYQLVEEISRQFPSEEISISEITAGFIRLSVITCQQFDYEEFSNEVDMLSDGLAISDISVRAATLSTVYERVIQNATFNMEKIRLLISTKGGRKANTIQTDIQ